MGRVSRMGAAGLVLVGWLSGWAAARAAEPARLVLAAEGKARMAVVVSPEAREETRQVAEELAEYLGRISGAKFTVQTGDGTRGIVLGTLSEFPNPALSKVLEIRNTYDGREAYAIRTERDRLLLISAADRGVPHAAFRLLEALGCRWFFPAKQWEVVPSLPTIAVSLEETDRPALLARRIWWGYGFFDHQRGVQEYQAWARHNRMGASFSIHCGHAWQSIIAANQKTFDAHPEYLALVGGKRQGPQFCVSRPEVRKLVLDYALDQFRRAPDQEMVSLETSDGSGHCECPECLRRGSISDRVFGLANEVAREIGRRHPGKMVGLYAYNDHCEPPSFPLEPNVYVQSTAGFIRGKYTFEELMELWPKRCRNLGFYEYLSVWLWDFDMPPGGRGADLSYLRRQIPRYVASHATSLDCESGNNWGIHGLGYYLANKLMWDPKADAEALLADFFQQAFGPAAAAVRRYYERFDPAGEPLVSEHLLGLALRDLDEAATRAEGRPDVQARLDHLKQYQHYVRLRWDLNRTADKDRQRDLALAALTHVYRTRYSYMNHWEAIRQSWTPQVAKQFDRPAWSFQDPSPDKPWRVESPVTHEETERLFREDLARFPLQPIEAKEFSLDLVPAGLSMKNPPPSRQQYQGKGRYALYSRQGEPLELTITTGIIAWYRDRPDAAYALTDRSGKEIAKGRLPQDGKEHPLTIGVPAPGVYFLEFNDQAAAWGIQTALGRPTSVLLRRGTGPAHLGHMQRMYFYVPKGTRRIDYFWEGGPHDVYGPDGRLAARVNTKGQFVHVTVPPGEDGKAWSIDKLCLGRLWFFNAPNVLAASPDALLLPRELLSPSQVLPVIR